MIDYTVTANYTNTAMDEVNLELEGSTDGYGTDSYNKRLINYADYKTAFLTARKRWNADCKSTATGNDEF